MIENPTSPKKSNITPSNTDSPMKTPMFPNSLVLVEPTNFKVNQEALKDNHFMKMMNESDEVVHNKVLNEHKNYISQLEKYQIPYKVYKQVHEDAHDSIFACDWFGTIKNSDFPEGILFLFPVRWPARRLERNMKIIEELKKDFKYFEDFTFFEDKDQALEAFGTMCLDYHNRILYINLSERCHIEPVKHFIGILNKYSTKGQYSYRLIESSDPKNGEPVFHTQMYLYFLDKLVIFCEDFVSDVAERQRLVNEFTNSKYKYELLRVSYEETMAMCCNIVEVEIKNSEKKGLIVSTTSIKAFSEANLKRLKELYEIIPIEVETVNECAGGSVRCMVNTIF